MEDIKSNMIVGSIKNGDLSEVERLVDLGYSVSIQEKPNQELNELKSSIVEAFIKSGKADNIPLDVVGEKVKEVLDDWNNE